MRFLDKVGICLLACLAFVCLTNDAQAFGGRLFGRGSCANGSCSQPIAVQHAAPVNVAPAHPVTTHAQPTAATHENATRDTGLHNRTAQGVANLMAHHGRVGHHGGNGRFLEGCGMAGSPAAAYSICCFAGDPSLVTVDVGYAQRGNMFFVCRRYARR